MKVHFLVLLSLSIGFASYSQTKPQTTELSETKVPFATVEVSPIYPGCFGETNIERKKCTQEAIHDFIKSNFNKTLLGPNDKRFGVHFLITKTGTISEISTTIYHKHLEEEAIRVISLLPKLEPGSRRGEKIGVLYGTPLDFSVKNHKNQKKSRRKKS